MDWKITCYLSALLVTSATQTGARLRSGESGRIGKAVHVRQHSPFTPFSIPSQSHSPPARRLLSVDSPPIEAVAPQSESASPEVQLAQAADPADHVPAPKPTSVGSANGLWNWTDTGSRHSSVVGIKVGEAFGTGVVLYVDRTSRIDNGYLGFCATANHVVSPASDGAIPITVTYVDGERSSGCRVVDSNEEVDVAILWVWVPAGIRPAALAHRRSRRGEMIEFVGLGGGVAARRRLRHFESTASAPTDAKYIFSDETLLPGDSGGPVFNAAGRLVGIISGGWFWWNHRAADGNPDPVQATWPARASNLIPLARLILELPDCSDGGATPGVHEFAGEHIDKAIPNNGRVPRRRKRPTPPADQRPPDSLLGADQPAGSPAAEDQDIYIDMGD